MSEYQVPMMNGKPMVIMKEWHINWLYSAQDDDYNPVLCGKSVGHPYIENNHRTVSSCILRIDKSWSRVETLNSVYLLQDRKEGFDPEDKFEHLIGEVSETE